MTVFYVALPGTRTFKLQNNQLQVNHLFGLVDGTTDRIETYNQSTFSNNLGIHRTIIMKLANHEVFQLTEMDVANFEDFLQEIKNTTTLDEHLKYRRGRTFGITLIVLGIIYTAFVVFSKV
ncbi:MAG: hypothetical protein ABJI92_18965 [Kangiellaceae bacterium]